MITRIGNLFLGALLCVSVETAILTVPAYADDDIARLLQKITSAKDESTRSKAIGTLKYMGRKEPVKVQAALVQLLKDPDEDVRSNATFALRIILNDKVATPGVVQALTRALKDPYRGVRENAIFGLSACGEKAAVAIPYILHAMGDKNNSARFEAWLLVFNLRPRLAASLKVEDRETLFYATREILFERIQRTFFVSDATRGKLETALQQTSFLNRHDLIEKFVQTTETLVQQGDIVGSPETIHAFIEDIKSVENLGLDEIAGTPESIQMLVESIETAQWPSEMDAAIRALGIIGPPGMEALMQALKNPNIEIQISSIYALGKVGEQVMQEQKRVLQKEDIDASAKKKAYLAIGVVSQKVLPALLEKMRDANSDVRIHSISGLGSITTQIPGAIPIFQNEDAPMEIYASLTTNIEKLPMRLTAMLTYEVEEVRRECADILQTLGDSGVARYLSKKNTALIVERLKAQISKEPSDHVKGALMRALITWESK